MAPCRCSSPGSGWVGAPGASWAAELETLPGVVQNQQKGASESDRDRGRWKRCSHLTLLKENEVGSGRAGPAAIQMPPPELCPGVGPPARPGTAFPSLLIIWMAARSRQGRQSVPVRCFPCFCMEFWPRVDAMLLFFFPPALSKLGQSEEWRGALRQPGPTPRARPLGHQVCPTRAAARPAAARPAVGYCGQPLPEEGKVGIKSEVVTF